MYAISYLASSKGICQKPLLASRTEKTLALGIRAVTSSIVGRGKCSRFIASFKFRGSRHILVLCGLITVTIELTQSVG